MLCCYCLFVVRNCCRLTGAAGDDDVGRAAAEATKGTKSLQPLHLEVSRASAGAIEAIESQGGTVTCAHFNRLALRALVSRCLLLLFASFFSCFFFVLLLLTCCVEVPALCEICILGRPLAGRMAKKEVDRAVRCTHSKGRGWVLRLLLCAHCSLLVVDGCVSGLTCTLGRGCLAAFSVGFAPAGEKRAAELPLLPYRPRCNRSNRQTVFYTACVLLSYKHPLSSLPVPYCIVHAYRVGPNSFTPDDFFVFVVLVFCSAFCLCVRVLVSVSFSLSNTAQAREVRAAAETGAAAPAPHALLPGPRQTGIPRP